MLYWVTHHNIGSRQSRPSPTRMRARIVPVLQVRLGRHCGLMPSLMQQYCRDTNVRACWSDEATPNPRHSRTLVNRRCCVNAIRVLGWPPGYGFSSVARQASALFACIGRSSDLERVLTATPRPEWWTLGPGVLAASYRPTRKENTRPVKSSVSPSGDLNVPCGFR